MSRLFLHLKSNGTGYCISQLEQNVADLGAERADFHLLTVVETEVQDQGTTRVAFRGGLCPWFADGTSCLRHGLSSGHTSEDSGVGGGLRRAFSFYEEASPI